MNAEAIQQMIEAKGKERNDLLAEISEKGKQQRVLEKEIRKLQDDLLKLYQQGKVKK